MIQKCKKPILLNDPRGGRMYVACGKCEPCRAQYKNVWMQRLDAECQRSTVTLFFTLTYDNNHIPTLTLDSKSNTLISNRHIDDDINISEYPQLAHCKLPLIQNDITDANRVGYCCKKDIQKFFKRLRRQLDYDTQNLLQKVSSEDRAFRYFVTSEYGPKTYRPHYHGLLFFDNQLVAEAVETYYFRQSWRLCSIKNMDISRVVSSASSYVAKYVSADADLPVVLTLKHKTKTFYLSSRRPAIGVNYFDYNSLVDKVKHHTTKYTRYREQDGVPISIDVPVFRSASNYYFPKVYKSDTYDTQMLCRYYTKAYQFISRRDAQCIVDSCDYITAFKLLSNELPHLVKVVEQKLVDYQKQYNPNATLSDMYHTLTYDEQLFGIYQNRSCIIKSIWYTLYHNINVFEYVQNYQQYYAVRSSETLTYMYELQQNMLDKGYTNLQVAKYFYPTFFLSLPQFFSDENTHFIICYYQTIKSLGLKHSDIYIDDVLQVDKLKINDEYVATIEYQAFINKTTDNLISFNKSREINHYINQKNENYESF